MNFSPTNSSLSFHNRSASSALVAHGLTGSTHGPVTWQSVRYLPLSGALNRAGQDSYQQDQDQELHRHGPRRLSPMVSGPAPSSLLGHPSRGREQLSCQSDIKIEKPQKVKGTFRAPRSSRPDLREGKVVGKIREGHPMVQTELKKVPGRKPSQPERRSWAYSPTKDPSAIHIKVTIQKPNPTQPMLITSNDNNPRTLRRQHLAPSP